MINVPYDMRDSLWRPLINLMFYIEGNILGNYYYRKRCGHVNSFSPRIIKELLKKYDFKIEYQRSNLRLNFLTVARKSVHKKSDSGQEWDQFWRRNNLLYKLINFGRNRYNKFFIKLLESKVNKESRLIELGCGTSSSILPLHLKVKELIGVDSSEEALKISKSNAKNLDVSNINFIHDDITNSNLKKNEYDVVWSQGLLEHFKDLKRALSEHIRICKSGGWVVISIPSKYSYFYIWYLLSKLPFMAWLWPWVEQTFFTKKELQKMMANIENVKTFRMYHPWHHLLGLIILEIKK